MAATPLERLVTRLSFAANQAGRVAWYAGHGAAMRRAVKRIDAQHDAKYPGTRPQIRKPRGAVPSTRRMLADIATLLKRDLENVEAGLYPLPADTDGPLPARLAASRAFFADVPEVARRRRESAHQEARRERGADKRPRYYQQNFHFQSGGWMTRESARLYDMQVEVLFTGSANAMRRQALAPMAEELAGRDQRSLCYADIACGTGNFLVQMRRAFPRLPCLAVDLSEAYLSEARRRIGRTSIVKPAVAKAEALPLADGALDLATCIFLFHELPPKIRRLVAAEIGRVVKPGGLFIFAESLQTGDEPDYDGLLELFPQLFHEPYFVSYQKTDVAKLFEDAGFVLEGTTHAVFSKIMRFRRVR
jgi:ubiquinone/menaquinone biosynthesis C-methylase UbiE